jgi:hypothetical protein
MIATKMTEAELAIFFGAALPLQCVFAHTGSAPKKLYGKSVVWTWSENCIHNIP